jgi:hypothetical protein
VAVRDIEDMERLGAPDPGTWPARQLSAMRRPPRSSMPRYSNEKRVLPLSIEQLLARAPSTNHVVPDACVLGNYSQALAPGALVIGSRSIASAIGAVALGSYAAADRSGQILIGTSRITPRLRAYFEDETNLFMSCLTTVSIEQRATVTATELRVGVRCSCGYQTPGCHLSWTTPIDTWPLADTDVDLLQEIIRMITDHEGKQLNNVWLSEPGSQLERIDRAFRSLRYAHEPLPMVDTAEDAARLVVWCDAHLRDLAGTRYAWWLEEWSRRANGMLEAEARLSSRNKE